MGQTNTLMTIAKLSKSLFKFILSSTGDAKQMTSNNNARGSSIGAKSSNPAQKNGPDVWVKKWVDYSTKYGLGYLLSNNSTGVFFNDSTKIISDPKGVHFYYMERKNADK